MPFDFNGKNASKKPNNNFNSNTDYASHTTGTIPRPSSKERPTFSDGSYGFASNCTQEPPKSTGFQNQPERRSGSRGNKGVSSSSSQSTGYTPRKTGIKPPSIHRPSSGTNIPWSSLLIIIGIIAIIAFCWIFREAITDFLMQLLTWVIIILIIIFVIKWFIFPKRK